jgi:hypothetical protein
LNLILFHFRPLESVQSCLKSLRDQMSDLQKSVNDQHVIGASSMLKYKLGFSCEKCEMRWEIDYQVKENQSPLDDNDQFLSDSIANQLPKCNCAKLQNAASNSEIETQTETDAKKDEIYVQ